MAQPKAVITPSRRLEKLDHITPLFKNVPIHCIPNGGSLLDEPDITLPSVETKTHYNLPRGNPNIQMAAARLTSHYKGMDRAVDALAGLNQMLTPEKSRRNVLLLGQNKDSIASQIRERAQFHVTQAWADTSEKLAAAYSAATDAPRLPDVAGNPELPLCIGLRNTHLPRSRSSSLIQFSSAR